MSDTPPADAPAEKPADKPAEKPAPKQAEPTTDNQDGSDDKPELVVYNPDEVPEVEAPNGEPYAGVSPDWMR